MIPLKTVGLCWSTDDSLSELTRSSIWSRVESGCKPVDLQETMGEGSEEEGEKGEEEEDGGGGIRRRGGGKSVLRFPENSLPELETRASSPTRYESR